MKDLVALTGQALAGLAVELVDVERAAGGLLRVTIDRPDGVRIEDCEAVSRQLSRVFEVEGIDYQRLEVGSPGTDRPLKSVADLRRFAGERAEVRLRAAIGGRRVFTGVLLAAHEMQTADGAAVSDESGIFGLEYEVSGSNTAPNAAGKPADSAGKTRAGKPRAGAPVATQILSFTFDDVERARLAPVLDFKGKKR